MKRNSILIALTLLVLQIGNVSAQEEKTFARGTEKVEFEKTSGSGGCYVFSRFVVMTNSGADVGEEIKIYRRAQSANAKNACQPKSAPYFTIKNADANYFAGLSDDFLFVDSGTSSDSRGLEIFNLQTKKSVFSTDYLDEFEFQPGGILIFDKSSTAKGSLRNCPQAAQWKKDGLTIGWIKKTKLNLQTLQETPVGAIRCRAFQ